jgi:hypothetical protein
MTTSTARVEAGTTYPMPPKQNWADDKPDLTEGSIGWEHMVSAEGDTLSVAIARRDWIDSDVITVGDVTVFVGAKDNDITRRRPGRSRPC